LQGINTTVTTKNSKKWRIQAHLGEDNTLETCLFSQSRVSQPTLMPSPISLKNNMTLVKSLVRQP